MIEAEHSLSCDSRIARSTASSRSARPTTTKWKWIAVKTFGSVGARSAVSATSQRGHDVPAAAQDQ